MQTFMDALNRPLHHLIERTILNGIESPEVRQELGKPSRRSIQVAASHEAGQVIIDIIDDGQGMDADELLALVDLAGEFEMARTYVDPGDGVGYPERRQAAFDRRSKDHSNPSTGHNGQKRRRNPAPEALEDVMTVERSINPRP